MFSFFTRKSKLQIKAGDIFQSDMHSHILPGIDDGSPDENTSLNLIKGMQACGINRFTGTPHIMSDVHINNHITITTAFKTLGDYIQAPDVQIPIKYAAEYMMDDGFLNKVAEGHMLTIFSNYVLIETPFYQEPVEIDAALFELEAAGYLGILAHPERYHYIDPKFKVLDKYKERGFPLQLNFLSLSGYYGSAEKDVATRLLEAGYYDFVGTDLHHERHLKRLSNMILDRKVIKLLEKTDFRNEEVFH